MITYEELKKEIYKEINIEQLPQSDQDRIMEKLGEVVLQRIAVDILKNLPEDKREEFKTLSDNGDLPALDDFVSVNLPNADEIISGAIKTVVDSVKGGGK